MSWINWILITAIGGLAVHYFLGRHKEMQLIVTESFLEPDQSLLVNSVLKTVDAATERLSLVDYKAQPETYIHQNSDVLRAVDEALERNPRLRVFAATAARRKTWLMRNLAERPRTIALTGAVGTAGAAMTVLADGGRYAWIVSSRGSALRHDCSKSTRHAIDIQLGLELETEQNIFGDAFATTREAETAAAADAPGGNRRWRDEDKQPS